jgi:hypothetical protein
MFTAYGIIFMQEQAAVRTLIPHLGRAEDTFEQAQE